MHKISFGMEDVKIEIKYFEDYFPCMEIRNANICDNFKFHTLDENFRDHYIFTFKKETKNWYMEKLGKNKKPIIVPNSYYLFCRSFFMYTNDSFHF